MGFFNRKKNKPEEDDFNLDDFDFDSLDDFDGGDLGDRKPSVKGFAKDVAISTSKNAAKRAAMETANDLIPGDFEYNLTEVKDLVGETRDILKDAVGETKQTLGELLPKRLREKFGIGKAGQSKGPSEQALKDAAVLNTLDEIFTKQTNMDKAVSRMGDVKGQGPEVAMAGLQNKLFTQMSNDLSKISGFMLSVESGYYRKSLEIQLKSYQLDMDMAKASTTFFKGITTQIDTVIKNTALPEHVKITNSERIDDFLKKNLIQKAYAGAFTNSDYINRFKDNMRKKIRSTLSDLKDGVGALVDLRDSTEGNNAMRMDMLSGMAGGYLGEKVSNKFLAKFGPRIKEKYKDNKRLHDFGYTLQNFVQNTGSAVENSRIKLKNRISDAEDQMGLAGTLKRFIYGGMDKTLSLFDKPKKDNKLKNDTLESFSQAKIFDKLAHRSVTEVIPMYLSKILHENIELRKMYGTINRKKLDKLGYEEGTYKRYNIFTRKLDTEDNIRASYDTAVKQSFNKDDQYDRMSKDIVNDAASLIDKNGVRGKMDYMRLKAGSSQDLMSSYIKHASRTGVKLDYETLILNANDKELADPNVKEYMMNNPELAELIEIVKKTKDAGEKGKNYAVTFNSKMDTVGSEYPYEAVRKFFDDISRLGEGIRINLTTEQAKIFAGAFIEFKENTGKVLSISERSFSEAFSYIDKSKIKYVEEPIILFGRILKGLLAKPDAQAKLALIIGTLETHLSLKTDKGVGKDKDLEIFQSVKDMDNEILGNIKQIGAKQRVTNSVYTQTETDRVDYETIRKLFTPDGDMVMAAHDSLFDTKFKPAFDFIDDVAGKWKEIDDDENETRLGKLRRKLKVTSEAGRKVVDKSYKTAFDAANQLGNIAVKVTDDTVKGTLNKLMSGTYHLDARMIQLREREETQFQTELDNLLALRNTADKTTFHTAEGIDAEIEALKARHSRRSELISKISAKTGEINSDARAKIENFDAGKVTGAVEAVRDTIAKKIEDLKGYLKIAEELEKTEGIIGA